MHWVARTSVDPARLRHGLLGHGYEELTISSDDAIRAAHLPVIHKDPFDRMLIAHAQSIVAALLTKDKTILRYPIACIAA